MDGSDDRSTQRAAESERSIALKIRARSTTRNRTAQLPVPTRMDDGRIRYPESGPSFRAHHTLASPVQLYTYEARCEELFIQGGTMVLESR